MLRITRGGAPRLDRIDLDGGAFVEVKAATLLEHHAALAHAETIAAAVQEGEAALDALGLVSPFAQEGAISVAALKEWAYRLELGASCVVAWGGIGDEDGAPLEAPTVATVKLLMADHVIAGRIVRSALRAVHAVVAEGEGSAVSRAGAPEAASTTAAPADPRANPAPPDGAAATAPFAPSENTQP